MKKIFLVLFSLIMMFSVSYGYEVKSFTSYEYSFSGSSTSIANHLDTTYTTAEVRNILNLLYNDRDNETYISAFNDLTNEMNALGYKWLVYDNGSEFYLCSSYDYDIAYGLKRCTTASSDKYYLGSLSTNTTGKVEVNVRVVFNSSSKVYYYYGSSTLGNNYFNIIKEFNLGETFEIYASNIDICLGTTDDKASFIWDGESYYYQPGSSGGDSENAPVIPELTDEEIAEIVERFINSDAYLDKAYYNGDYFITYDNLTGYFRGYSYSWNIDLAIEYGNYNEEGEFITTGTKEGEAWRIRPYEFSGDIFNKFGDWLASKFNTYAFEYFSISPDSSIEPRYIGSLEHNYCSNYIDNEVVIYSSKQIRYVGEETDDEGNTETVVTDNYIPPTILKDSETGEQIVIRDNLKESSDSLETIITPNADFSGLKQAFEKYISFVNISSITWLTTAISSMITIFVPFVALGIIIFLINRILNGGS